MQSLWPSYFIGRPILNSNVHAREPKETSQLPGQGRCPSGPLQPKVRVGWEELGRDICTKGYSQKIYLKTRPQLPGPHLGGRLRCVWLTGVPEARPYGGPFNVGRCWSDWTADWPGVEPRPSKATWLGQHTEPAPCVRELWQGGGLSQCERALRAHLQQLLKEKFRGQQSNCRSSLFCAGEVSQQISHNVMWYMCSDYKIQLPHFLISFRS